MEGFAGADAGATQEAAPWWTVLHAPASPAFALRRCMRGTLHLVPRTLLKEIVSVYGEKAIEEEEGEKKKSNQNNNNKKDQKMKDEDEEEADEAEEHEDGEGDEEAGGEEEEEGTRSTKFRVLNFYKIPLEEAEEVGKSPFSIFHFLFFYLSLIYFMLLY